MDQRRTAPPNWLERNRACLAVTAHREHDPAFGTVFSHGRGATLWDVEGRDYIDLTCGYSVTNFGHAFEPLVSAVQQQIGQLTHLTGALHPGKIELAERLISQLAPSPDCDNKVIFNATGARAIESAWKAAVAYRPGKLLTLSPGFHGRSLATAPISSVAPVGPGLEPTSYLVNPAERYPHCHSCPLGLKFPSCSIRCGDELFADIEKHSHELSAVLVEPAIGARGYIFPPKEYFQRLREVTQRAGVLLIADEIQTGLGRCGDWLLCRRQAWTPDLVVLGKSLGGGIVPISAVVGRADILDSLPCGTESETFAATPLACRVALRVIEELSRGPWMKRGAEVGEDLRGWFTEFSSKTSGFSSKPGEIQAVEGEGACCVLEFAGSTQLGNVTQCEQRAARQFAERLHAARLLVHLSGPARTRVVMLPPLTISDEEIIEVKQRTLSA